MDSPTCTTHSQLVNMPGDPRWTVPPAQHTVNLSTCQVTPGGQHLGQSHLHNTWPAQVNTPGDDPMNSPTCTTHSQLKSTCQVTPGVQCLGRSHLHNTWPAQVNTLGDPRWPIPPAQYKASSSQDARWASKCIKCANISIKSAWTIPQEYS